MMGVYPANGSAASGSTTAAPIATMTGNPPIGSAPTPSPATRISLPISRFERALPVIASRFDISSTIGSLQRLVDHVIALADPALPNAAGGSSILPLASLRQKLAKVNYILALGYESSHLDIIASGRESPSSRLLRYKFALHLQIASLEKEIDPACKDRTTPLVAMGADDLFAVCGETEIDIYIHFLGNSDAAPTHVDFIALRTSYQFSDTNGLTRTTRQMKTLEREVLRVMPVASSRQTTTIESTSCIKVSLPSISDFQSSVTDSDKTTWVWPDRILVCFKNLRHAWTGNSVINTVIPAEPHSKIPGITKEPFEDESTAPPPTGDAISQVEPSPANPGSGILPRPSPSLTTCLSALDEKDWVQFNATIRKLESSDDVLKVFQSCLHRDRHVHGLIILLGCGIVDGPVLVRAFAEGVLTRVDSCKLGLVDTLMGAYHYNTINQALADYKHRGRGGTVTQPIGLASPPPTGSGGAPLVTTGRSGSTSGSTWSLGLQTGLSSPVQSADQDAAKNLLNVLSTGSKIDAHSTADPVATVKMTDYSQGGLPTSIKRSSSTQGSANPSSATKRQKVTEKKPRAGGKTGTRGNGSQQNGSGGAGSASRSVVTKLEVIEHRPTGVPATPFVFPNGVPLLGVFLSKDQVAAVALMDEVLQYVTSSGGKGQLPTTPSYTRSRRGPGQSGEDKQGPCEICSACSVFSTFYTLLRYARVLAFERNHPVDVIQKQLSIPLVRQVMSAVREAMRRHKYECQCQIQVRKEFHVKGEWVLRGGLKEHIRAVKQILKLQHCSKQHGWHHVDEPCVHGKRGVHLRTQFKNCRQAYHDSVYIHLARHVLLDIFPNSDSSQLPTGSLSRAPTPLTTGASRKPDGAVKS